MRDVFVYIKVDIQDYISVEYVSLLTAAAKRERSRHAIAGGTPLHHERFT